MKVAVLLLSLTAFAADALAGESPANVAAADRLLQLGCLDITKVPNSADPQTVTCDGSNAIVQEKSAIKGTVFQDRNQSGNKLGQGRRRCNAKTVMKLRAGVSRSDFICRGKWASL